MIKKLQRLAITLILRNPNFSILGFPIVAIFKLWGELYLWAATVINFKPCPMDPTKTRWEVFLGYAPNMQDVRLLPIGCILIVVREPTWDPGVDVKVGVVVVNDLKGQIGIYVGPSLTTPESH